MMQVSAAMQVKKASYSLHGPPQTRGDVAVYQTDWMYISSRTSSAEDAAQAAAQEGCIVATNIP